MPTPATQRDRRGEDADDAAPGARCDASGRSYTQLLMGSKSGRLLELKVKDAWLVARWLLRVASCPSSRRLPVSLHCNFSALRSLQANPNEVEDRLPQKISTETAVDSEPPLLDLETGAGTSHAPLGGYFYAGTDNASGMFPLFERFMRVELEGKEGNSLDLTQLPGLNFELLPSRIGCLEGAISALKIANTLVAQLDNISRLTRFAHFQEIFLIQCVFTRLLPLPMGPISRQRVGAKDPVWGADATHEQQVDVSIVLVRLAPHYGISCGMTFDHRGFDGTRAIILYKPSSWRPGS